MTMLPAKAAEVKVDTTVLSRVGLDSDAHLSSSNVALVMSVVNEMDSTMHCFVRPQGIGRRIRCESHADCEGRLWS